MQHYIHIRLEAPLIAFGRTIVDNLGMIQEFPSAAAMTGLIANSLGWQRADTKKLQSLQECLVYGVRVDRSASTRMTDFQTAKLNKSDIAWTSRGQPEGRPGGGPDKYESPHLRYREVDADACLSVLLRLNATDGNPSLADIAKALQYPARPIFLGRKHCLPSTFLFAGYVEAGNVIDALKKAPHLDAEANLTSYMAYWPQDEGEHENSTLFEITDRRNWSAGVHAGHSVWKRGDITLQAEGEDS